MGLFSLLRSSSPKKAKPTAGEIAEQQQLLSPQVLIPAPPLPAPADPAPDAGVSIPLNGGSTAAAAAEFSTTDLPVNGTAADKLPTPPNSQGGTPTSSNRSWRKNGTKSPKMSDRDKGKLRAGTLAEEHVSTTAVAAAAAAASAADPADAAAAAASESFSLRMSGGAIAVAKPFGGPAARTAASSASSPPSHFEKKKRRNSRGLSYGMGFEEIGSWGQPEWSGAYTDRSAGQRGRPERAKDGTKNWVVPHPPVRPEDFEKRAEEAKPEVKEEKGSQYTPVPNLELHSAPLPAAPEAERPDFSGVWRCTSTDGCWDEYLKRCDVDSTRRALARGTDYGTGRSVQVKLVYPPAVAVRPLAQDRPPRRLDTSAPPAHVPSPPSLLAVDDRHVRDEERPHHLERHRPAVSRHRRVRAGESTVASEDTGGALRSLGGPRRTKCHLWWPLLTSPPTLPTARSGGREGQGGLCRLERDAEQGGR